ncbi:hypothetical protein MVEG_05812 [Podila verticillata NRRL 6337]|nr:hypothetical protein MVEG_05812 [Podila verticillata NRRL 6337]
MSILSTHSGHHRIFIGPVVQKQANNNHVDEPTTTPTTPSPSGTHHRHQQQRPHHNNSSSAPKPWWEGSSFLRSRLSLSHYPTPPASGSSKAHSDTHGPTETTSPVSSTSGQPLNTPLAQSSIPQFSYTFSDDNDSEGLSDDSEDNDDDLYDSKDEQRDYDHDHDSGSDSDEDNDQRDHNSTNSFESLSEPVGHSQDISEQSGQMQSQTTTPHAHPYPIHPQDAASFKQDQVDRNQLEKSKRKDKGKAKEEPSSTHGVSRWTSTKTKGKRRTRSMRDEGEPNRFKKILGTFRDKTHHQGRLDNPDLGWESDGSRRAKGRASRQMTSGALTMGHQHQTRDQQPHQEHHTVLVSSPMSSEIDLPGTNVPFVSSPVSSVFDVDQERPIPYPIQKPGELLSPEPQWKSASNSSLSSIPSPMRSNVQRGATWVTAKEYASSIGQGSLYQQAIKEESEPDDETAGEYDGENGAGVGSPKDMDGRTREVEDLAIAEEPESKPLTDTISKASTRFGRALLRRAPTGLKPQGASQGDTTVKPKVAREDQVNSVCSQDREYQKSLESVHEKKHVRFLTKVQYQIAASRQPTLFTNHPVVKQDRMLVRKEVTERPGPHVFNSDTARRLERQSEGWKEWWCVMKGPPTGAKPKETKIRKKSKDAQRAEKGRLEFYYNHKKIKGTVILSSRTSVSVYSSLDYSIAITQNYPEALGLTIYIIRPRTISLACAWYMEIYTLLNGAAPIPSFIEIAVPDFDVKIRVPIPEDSESESGSSDEETIDEPNNTDLSPSLPIRPPNLNQTNDVENDNVLDSFRTARTSLPARMASKTFYLTNDSAKPTLVAPDEVTPKLLRSHVLSLLKDVPDWTEVVKMWQDPTQHGDVALCWKRYDRIEWIYWGDRVSAETDSLHLKKDHVGFADGSDWSGNMDETVVGPQVLDKTHRLELRPITHYPTTARDTHGQEFHEPDPIEGFLVRVSTFSGNPIRRFRRLYLTSHDQMLIYTVPSESHSPAMQHAGSIDSSALLFCISPHRSANPDHKDMAQSRSVRRLKAQVRAARGFIDMTQIEQVRVLTEHEWSVTRHMSAKKDKAKKKASRLEKLRHKAAELARTKAAHPPTVQVASEADNYFFPEIRTEPVVQETVTSEPQATSAQDVTNGQPDESLVGGMFKDTLVRSATVVADLLLHNDNGSEERHTEAEPSNVIEIEMKDGTCVRFRAYNADAAKLWRDQLDRLAQYWRLRKHLDIKAHMQVAQANYQLASSLDDDEIQVGEVMQEWDNDRAMVDPEIWNWCVVNGCRSITKSGVLYYKPRLHSTFRKMYLVLTEGFLMLFHPHRRSKASGELVPTTTCKLYAIHSLTDIYIYSGHFSDEDTSHGTNDESERLPRFFPDGLIVDDPDEDCTFSIWRGKRRKMFSRRGAAMTTMSSRTMAGNSRIFGQNGLLSSMVKDGVVYGSGPQSCTVLRARSRSDLEEWVYALNTEIERCVRAERRRIRTTGHS